MRTAIGIELGARTVRVVAINDDANRAVIARADRSGAEGVLAKIAQAAVRERLKSAGGTPPPAAICAHNPDDVRQECARRLPPSLAETVRIEMSPLGEDAAAIGAARLALT